LQLVNLGIGAGKDRASIEGGDEEEEQEQPETDRQLFSLVVEEVEERFAGEEGESRIQEILGIMKIGLRGEVESKRVNGTSEKEGDGASEAS